jgi:hypothetical protein
MSDPDAPPRSRLADAPPQELGWSSFTQARRIAIFLNGLTAAGACVLALAIGGSLAEMTLPLLYGGVAMLGFFALEFDPRRLAGNPVNIAVIAVVQEFVVLPAGAALAAHLCGFGNARALRRARAAAVAASSPNHPCAA